MFYGLKLNLPNIVNDPTNNEILKSVNDKLKTNTFAVVRISLTVIIEPIKIKLP